MAEKYTVAYYAMYVIAETESNWNWQSIYYEDPITIGIMQWYGVRAAALLLRFQFEQPSLYAQLASSLRADLGAHSASDTYWNSRNLNQNEGDTIQSIFATSEAHTIQEEQAISDLGAYIDRFLNIGFSLDNPKPLIFAMSMYHQSPVACNRVVATAGANATLERIYQVCLNDKTLGLYKNRYTTNFNRLNAWDGVSMPPDFGQNGGVSESGGNNAGISATSIQLSHILEQGNTLVLFGNTFPEGVVFYPACGNRWVCGTDTGGVQITGGNTGGGTSTNVQSVVDLYLSWVGRFVYSQGDGRLTPLSSGYGDCSSTIWAAYHDAMGIDIGTWTGAQENKGVLIAEGHGATLPLNQMAAGDLILYWKWNLLPSYHVEMYIGDNKLCGHGGPGLGPTIKENAQTWSAQDKWSKWQVRRYA